MTTANLRGGPRQEGAFGAHRLRKRPRFPPLLGMIGSVLGLFFSAFSTHDYATHLDRQLHGTHCSFLPGLTDVEKGENACKAAMYSPYSSLFRDKLWGGIPISLFALGVYSAFFAMSLYLLVAGNRASKRSWQAYGIAVLTPLPVTGLMFYLSAVRIGEFCKLCMGLYAASIVLAAAGIAALVKASGKLTQKQRQEIDDAASTVVDPEPWHQRAKEIDRDLLKAKEATAKPAPTLVDEPIAAGSVLVFPLFLVAAGAAAVLPAAVYAASVGDYKPFVTGCGTLAETTEKHDAFVKLPTKNPSFAALTFEDPLCPTCRAFHQRLVTEGVYDKLDLTVAIFPLDAECNFLLTSQSLHPGACVVAKAFLCAEKSNQSRAVLEWAYENQDMLTKAGKAGKDEIRAKVFKKFPDVDKCIDAKETQQRLDHILQFAVDQHLPVMTPQLFLGQQRVCDEDTDLGLTYALKQLAPKVLQ
ncbi:MAG: vitamin K epoxide reductase family protein [Polyangiaceae bacterium]